MRVCVLACVFICVHMCMYVCLCVCMSKYGCCTCICACMCNICVSALSAWLPHPSYHGKNQPFPTVFACSSIYVLVCVHMCAYMYVSSQVKSSFSQVFRPSLTLTQRSLQDHKKKNH